MMATTHATNSAETNDHHKSGSGSRRVPSLWITGLGAQYPPYLLGPEGLEYLAKKFYDTESLGLVVF